VTEEEVALHGGRDTQGVVRVGSTVRRPVRANSAFVHELLIHLEHAGFERVPRFLGHDEGGREVLSFVAGDVPADLDAHHSDAVLAEAARMIAEYHRAVAGCKLAGSEEIVCHNDLSPCNFAFRDGLPWGVFDFDGAAPGSRVHELAYALFTWLNVGTDGPPPVEQGRRARVFLDAYGASSSPLLVPKMLELTAAKRDWREANGIDQPGGWWDAQHRWLLEHGAVLERAVAVPSL
jgi:aminoglycoside phosphotransferase (APT) family kinase protein